MANVGTSQRPNLLAGRRLRSKFVSGQDVPIETMLWFFGLTAEVVTEARGLIEAEGLTNPRKDRISVAKLDFVKQVIDRHWERLCHHCSRTSVPRSRIVVVPAWACVTCSGSRNAGGAREMVRSCEEAGAQRLVFIGGSPSCREELKRLIGHHLECRFVDGTGSRNKKQARHDIAWADFVVVMGATELSHNVSRLYTQQPSARGKLLITHRRGVEAIALEICRRLKHRS